MPIPKVELVASNQEDGLQSAQSNLVLHGRAMLATGDEFVCTARNVTVKSAEIIATVHVELAQIVVCSFEHLGILPGKITSVEDTHFVVGFTINDRRRLRMAAQLEWQSQHVSHDIELLRAPRITPIHRSVEVRLGEQILFHGSILNVSRSGAAIKLNHPDLPFVGAYVRVGKRFATVIRLIDGGIAVQFATPFPSNSFDERIRL